MIFVISSSLKQYSHIIFLECPVKRNKSALVLKRKEVVCIKVI